MEMKEQRGWTALVQAHKEEMDMELPGGRKRGTAKTRRDERGYVVGCCDRGSCRKQSEMEANDLLRRPWK